MIGAIIGDIVGSRFEFHNHRSTEFELFHPDCKFTDDTVMTVAVADAILKGRPFGEVMHEYGRKYPRCGYGGRFFRWLLSNNPEPYDSFGNGSAMRVSPCAFLAKGSREQALTWATASAVCTHNHPEGVKGAMAIADCILLAMQHKPKEEMAQLFIAKGRNIGLGSDTVKFCGRLSYFADYETGDLSAPYQEHNEKLPF